MSKKITVIFIGILLFLVGGFLIIKYEVLKTQDFKPDASKQKNIIDLRPSIIAKLQQLVRDGSNGLYVLSIEKIEPELQHSKLLIVKAAIDIDTSVMQELKLEKKLPDDVFKIEFDSLLIDGIGLNDLVDKKKVDIIAVNVSRPIIKVYHEVQPYNNTERETNKGLSLYQRIRKKMDRISIGKINISDGTLISQQTLHKKITRFNGIDIKINDLLIDSTTEFDTSRFLFAKHVQIVTQNYNLLTRDNLYDLQIGSVSIIAEQQLISLRNLRLHPRNNRQELKHKLRYRREIYDINLPKINFTKVNWWAMANNEGFIAQKGEINEGTLKIFLDRSLPKNPNIKVNNFPHQQLMKLPFPISVEKLMLKDVNIAYEEFNPDANKSATAYFDKINGELKNVSNIKTDLNKNPSASVFVKGLFMHHIPTTANFSFNLSQYKKGNYSVDIHMSALDNISINSLAEPLGLFSVKSGIMEDGTAHITGDNLNTSAEVVIKYSDLHIKPLKKADGTGHLKKKHFTGFFANAFFIKNLNPQRGKELRKAQFSIETDRHRNFMNMVWVTVLTGVLKTVGIPVKMVIP